MKIIYPLLIAILFMLLSCSTNHNSYNTFEYKENSSSMKMGFPIEIDDFSAIFEQSIYSDFTTDEGMLRDTFTITQEGIHRLSNPILSLDLYLAKGDVTEMSVDLSNSNPEVTFTGDHSEINNALFENKKFFVSAFSKIDKNNLNEKIVADVIEGYESGKKKENFTNTLARNKVAAGYADTWNEASIISTILLVKYKLNKFSKEKIETPRLDVYLNKFDATNLDKFNNNDLYKMASYEYHKWRYNEKYDYDRDLKRFRDFVMSNKMDQSIRDYLLSIYATNYFIVEYKSAEKIKTTYEYLLTVIDNLECRDYLYKSYVQASRSK